MSGATMAALVLVIIGIEVLRRRQLKMLHGSNAYLRGKNQQLSVLLTDSYVRRFGK